MKLNRAMSFAIVALAITLALGQSLSSGAKAAPHASFSASITAQANKGGSPAASGKSSQVKVDRADANSQEPLNISVEGRLTNPSGQPITVNTPAVFGVYSVASGGSPLFTQSVTLTPDSNGLFTAQLTVPTNDAGGIYDNVRYFAGKLYIGLTLGSDAEMTPRFELTAAPYALSLAPGALIEGNFDYTSNALNALLNVTNDNISNPNSRGIQANGPIGVYGFGTSNTSGSSIGGYFSAANELISNGVVGVADTSPSGVGTGGVFTGTFGAIGYGRVGIMGYGNGSNNAEGVDGYVNGGANFDVKGMSASGVGVQAFGIYASGDGTNSYAVWGTAVGANASDEGVYAESYSDSNALVALQVKGIGQATGGFVTGGVYGMMVHYDGIGDLHTGDVLALDGNNETMNGAVVLGTAKAVTSDTAIGVAQHRYLLFSAAAIPANGHQPAEPARITAQVDDQATIFHPGDYIEVAVMGQAQMKVAGPVSIGARLGLDGAGNVVVAKDAATSIGHVASLPDKDGNVIVFVNFK